jgi:LytS/YehU family sensor histidine kinase
MTTGQRIEQLKHEIEPLRQQLISHHLYNNINTINDLHVFMQHHIFAV